MQPVIASHWRSIEEKPGEDQRDLTAVLACIPDEPGELPYLEAGIYLWKGHQWVEENFAIPAPHSARWWCPESELVAAFCLPGTSEADDASLVSMLERSGFRVTRHLTGRYSVSGMSLERFAAFAALARAEA